MKILIIEDDLTLNELITDYLKLNDNVVVSLFTASKFEFYCFRL